MNKYQNLLAQTYDLTAQGKLAEFSTFLAADATWTESAGFPYAGTYSGADEILRNVHQRLGTEWEGYRADPIAYTFNGLEAMVYGRYSGTYRESGKSFTADFVHYYTFNKDDKIARFVQIVDSVPVVEAMQK